MSGKYTKLVYLVPVLILLAFFTSYFSAGEKGEALAQAGCTATNLSGEIETTGNLAYFDDKQVLVPLNGSVGNGQAVLSAASPDERWIEVDLSEQKLRAWDGDELFLETLVSTGLPGTPTPTGEFRIWIKLRATKMEGGEGANYYYLPNVPYVMFFENSETPGIQGYGLHGTYWHDDFGTPKSHGCVNLPTSVAEQIYFWATPEIPGSASHARATEDNPGTRIVIHD